MVRTVGWLALGCALLGRSGLAQGGGPVSARWAFDPGGSVRIMNPYGQIRVIGWDVDSLAVAGRLRSEEHTSELQSRLHLVCRLLLEKKKKQGVLRSLESIQMSIPGQAAILADAGSQ